MSPRPCRRAAHTSCETTTPGSVSNSLTVTTRLEPRQRSAGETVFPVPQKAAEFEVELVEQVDRDHQRQRKNYPRLRNRATGSTAQALPRFSRRNGQDRVFVTCKYAVIKPRTLMVIDASWSLAPDNVDVALADTAHSERAAAACAGRERKRIVNSTCLAQQGCLARYQ